MLNAATAISAETPYTERARFYSPANIFKTKKAPVPCHMFVEERDRAMDENTPSGLIGMDLSADIGLPYPATTPFLMAHYARIRSGEQLSTELRANGEIYYVIRGSGTSENGDDVIAWNPGDIFCFSGGNTTTHHAGDEHAVLLIYTDEPLVAFSGAEPPAPGKGPVQAVHYLADQTRLHLDEVRARTQDEDAAGVAIQFVSPATEATGTCIPSIALAVNSLEPGKSQRAHIHNSVALTLCIEGQGCYSMIDGERVDWQPDTVMVTPPAAVHSHHNEGGGLMRCLIAQDSGLYYHARTIGFSFVD